MLVYLKNLFLFSIFFFHGFSFGFGSSKGLIPMFNFCVSSNKKTKKKTTLMFNFDADPKPQL
jgi:hypothetical protein